MLPFIHHEYIVYKLTYKFTKFTTLTYLEKMLLGSNVDIYISTLLLFSATFTNNTAETCIRKENYVLCCFCDFMFPVLPGI